MSTPTGPAPGLPVRMPRPRQSGRHRRPETVAAPQGAPTLVLAVPGAPGPAVRSLADELASITRSELPGLEAFAAFLDGDDADGEYPTVGGAVARAAALRDERYALAVAAGRDAAEPEGPAAVVVPLLAGPDASLITRIREAVAESGAQAEVTDVLGPHPLLAEALHVRLSEAGLARADRARLFTVATAADGIILASVGGKEAVQTAGITGMLLAARLAVPVMAAALDEEGAVASVAQQLRDAGSVQLALAPYLVGPELPEGLLDTAVKEADCATAEPLGAYPAIGKLVLARYVAATGVVPQTQESPAS
ncbi:sirohydrochlorin chelatase [Streptomyces sp. 8L]|uniref:sirohydrochlorin chelatase n=1 Tax=Streptomyces sp. 8L TaxID=2877242 RepID=UPI001CD42DFD|nr:hypothetical protein [Streptomyces sp. 8L]MCA1222384.1 hypothetical protein [Streptomyces sp. 8L]